LSLGNNMDTYLGNGVGLTSTGSANPLTIYEFVYPTCVWDKRLFYQVGYSERTRLNSFKDWLCAQVG
jgi:hypothetical protein